MLKSTVFISSDHSNTLNKLFYKNLSDQAVTIGTKIERCKPLINQIETIRTKTTSSKACELKFMCHLKVVFPRKHVKLLLLVSGKTLGYVLRSVCLVLYDLALPRGDNVPLSNEQLTDFTSESGFEFWLSYKRSSPLCFARNFIKTKNTSFSNF